MHNCKLTRRSFIDLALDEVSPASSLQLPAELKDCQACQDEYAALRSTLHVSNQALRSVLPGEEFWSGYHTRLQSKLLAAPQQVNAGEEHSLPHLSLSSQLWLALRAMATTSLRVPLPAALALMLLVGASFLVLRSRRPANVTPATPVALVETHTVQIPVIQEKVVTRVVYVEKKGRRSASRANPLDRRETSAGDPAARTALSFVGFKPTDTLLIPWKIYRRLKNQP